MIIYGFFFTLLLLPLLRNTEYFSSTMRQQCRWQVISFGFVFLSFRLLLLLTKQLLSDARWVLECVEWLENKVDNTESGLNKYLKYFILVNCLFEIGENPLTTKLLFGYLNIWMRCCCCCCYCCFFGNDSKMCSLSFHKCLLSVVFVIL